MNSKVKIWVEYEGKDADLCQECKNATFLIDDWGKTKEVHAFCDKLVTDRTETECPQFEKL